MSCKKHRLDVYNKYKINVGEFPGKKKYQVEHAPANYAGLG